MVKMSGEHVTQFRENDHAGTREFYSRGSLTIQWTHICTQQCRVSRAETWPLEDNRASPLVG